VIEHKLAQANKEVFTNDNRSSFFSIQSEKSKSNFNNNNNLNINNEFTKSSSSFYFAANKQK
jgi:hypothetical protein